MLVACRLLTSLFRMPGPRLPWNISLLLFAMLFMMALGERAPLPTRCIMPPKLLSDLRTEEKIAYTS